MSEKNTRELIMKGNNRTATIHVCYKEIILTEIRLTGQ